MLNLQPADTLILAEKIWWVLIDNTLLKERTVNQTKFYQLFEDRLLVDTSELRFICNRCRLVTAYSVRNCCPRKFCSGQLEEKSFDGTQENTIARWVAGIGVPRFTTLRSEEHTAQINKDLAKRIEDQFRGEGGKSSKNGGKSSKNSEEVIRAEGINLLSSTTTFEMGINIGDLQKVLLRNAPPSSASYVQRVGRAGRGNDKNSICVTLCRRLKYDGDMWRMPQQLMSGNIRTPTVFIENNIIAQRHFNAVVFARFLRTKIHNEKILGEEKQVIRLAAFLPLTSRKGVENWLNIYPADLYLDFLGWLETEDESDFFHTKSGKSLVDAVAGFETGKEKLIDEYKGVFVNITAELEVLVDEMDRLGKERLYRDASEIESAVKNLINSDVISTLAKRGFLPRYAFPLETVTLETQKSRWARKSDVELSRDRAIAISEFAPGAQVIAHKRVFTSEGLYIVSREDKPDKKFYARCKACDQIVTSDVENSLKGSDCKTCGEKIQKVAAYVEPNNFSVRIEKGNENSSRHRPSSLIRQRQSLTHFIDIIKDEDFKDFGLFTIALKRDGKLFRYNLGPKNEGFMLCQDCGCSMPSGRYRVNKGHNRLRATRGSMKCESTNVLNRLAYGHVFYSYCLIARPTKFVDSKIVSSLAFALQKGLCKVLEVEPADIGVVGRWRSRKDAFGPNAEIVLFDNTPGGAGFVEEGYERWNSVVIEAGKLVKACNCDLEGACYDCLKDYSNQSEHDNLSRGLVLDYLGGG